MKVYTVYFGCVHEGGGVEAIYSTVEAAREYALARVAEEQAKLDLRLRYNKHRWPDDPERAESRYRTWVKDDTDCWSDNFDAIVVSECELDNPEHMESLRVHVAREVEYYNELMNKPFKDDDV